MLLSVLVVGSALPAAAELAEWQRDGDGLGEAPTDVAVTEDGAILYAYILEWLFGGELPVPGDLVVLDPTSGEMVEVLPVPSGWSIDVTSDRILVARQDEFEPPRLEVWDWEGRLLGSREWPDLWADSFWITDVAISGSKAVVIVSTNDSSNVVLFDLRDMSLLRRLETTAEPSRYVAVAATDGIILVTVENRVFDGSGGDRFQDTTVHVYRDQEMVRDITLTRAGDPVRGSAVEPAPGGAFYVLGDQDFADRTVPPTVTMHDSSGVLVEELWRSPDGFSSVGIDSDGCVGLIGLVSTDDLSSVRGFKYVPDAQRRSCFIDTFNSPFNDSIVWLGSEAITRGCNPPLRDRFCPDDVITRGEMAAFLVRALGYNDGGGGLFEDTRDHLFASEIDRLAVAGVTRGCNPPKNDRYCPDDLVTRGQMAAFLVRALHYTDNGGGNLFIDVDGNTFDADIDKLGTAGITKGCNPPVNDHFCPDDFVTRGEMAAFLHRALDS